MAKLLRSLVLSVGTGRCKVPRCLENMYDMFARIKVVIGSVASADIFPLMKVRRCRMFRGA